ncbi:GspMb/PilO family protein [Prochlorococcus sp. MIT 0801]|uniref:type 4a pilus biogenesis protein PilO n=1 Tax=Prochlorococcus sp. MIT 0801 TaxID=1501269 RepID=UPI0004F6F85F|nr:GspMb/PilO family protein [Prochlorococcus sp. MIT 0801]AIQ97329.1 hypothetical protein EW15_1237 [Prochlorococcus sp. MIT 0801]
MTNLSSNKLKRKFITPERTLLFTPILVGLIIFVSLMTFAFRPLIKKLNVEEAKIKTYETKVSYIPIYKRYIKDISNVRNKVSNQQKRLVDLISDPNELDTILAQINKLCIKNNINILSIIPQEIVNQSNSKDKNDPFLIPKVEKHVFKINLEGSFNGLIDFLKDLELLQTIVISDNINILVSSDNTNKINDKNTINLRMSFDLSTYARKGSINSFKQNNKNL